MRTLTPGDILQGKYQIVGVIGRGGFGAVYEVENLHLGGRNALKLLTVDVHENPDLFVRFQNEARAQNQIEHPGIVPVIDSAHLEDGTPYLVLPFLQGETLWQRIERARATPEKALGLDGLSIAYDVASALAAAHEKEIIHRDVKPQNIMIVANRSATTGEQAKVLDFGIAKLYSDNLTRRGAILGTPVFMPLEQFIDSAQVTGKADVFSLGCILYLMLCGQTPHPSRPHYEMMGKRVNEPIVPIADRVPGLPLVIADLVSRMLSIPVEPRPTMAEVEETLRVFLQRPLPKQTGRVAVVIAGGVGRVPLPTVDHTASAPSIQLVVEPTGSTGATPSLGPSLLLGTPSESAKGEASPRPVVVPNVPESLSLVPTAPMRLPAITSAPLDPTFQPAPTPAIPAAESTPNAPTLPAPAGLASAPHARRRLAIPLGLFGIVGIGALALWAMLREVPSQRAATPVPTPPTAPVAALLPPLAAATPSAPPPAVETAPPARVLDAIAPLVKPKPSHSVIPKESASNPPCVPVPLSDACTVSPAVTDVQQAQIIAALRHEEVLLCPGESIELGGLPGAPKILRAPDSVTRRQHAAIPLTLRNKIRNDILPSAGLPSKLRVKCPRR